MLLSEFGRFLTAIRYSASSLLVLNGFCCYETSCFIFGHKDVSATWDCRAHYLCQAGCVFICVYLFASLQDYTKTSGYIIIMKRGGGMHCGSGKSQFNCGADP